LRVEAGKVGWVKEGAAVVVEVLEEEDRVVAVAAAGCPVVRDQSH
jgi:hypothetical protein